ncbi:unnamed protein product [Phytophthora fragariaefolia]|uniref:Unnamed protein product n=1 Tax=Phytophthora fragariaefolia TaxID=1490495 RepID=A0A9W7CX76_9STRA|nr:unnamed protein product [Phytophthora fragariaefolia]
MGGSAGRFLPGRREQGQGGGRGSAGRDVRAEGAWRGVGGQSETRSDEFVPGGMQAFDNVVELIPTAEQVIKLNAICSSCGHDAGTLADLI